MNTLKGLVAHANWANRLWLEIVASRANNDEYLRRLISHIYLAEQAWFQRIFAEEVRPDVFSTLECDELRQMADRHAGRYAEVLATDLSRVIAYRRFNGDPYESSVLDILNHVITHGAHHRGQMAAYASRVEIAPPDTSYISFARLGKA